MKMKNFAILVGIGAAILLSLFRGFAWLTIRRLKKKVNVQTRR